MRQITAGLMMVVVLGLTTAAAKAGDPYYDKLDRARDDARRDADKADKKKMYDEIDRRNDEAKKKGFEKDTENMFNLTTPTPLCVKSCHSMSLVVLGSLVMVRPWVTWVLPTTRMERTQAAPVLIKPYRMEASAAEQRRMPESEWIASCCSKNVDRRPGRGLVQPLWCFQIIRLDV